MSLRGDIFFDPKELLANLPQFCHPRYGLCRAGNVGTDNLRLLGLSGPARTWVAHVVGFYSPAHKSKIRLYFLFLVL